MIKSIYLHIPFCAQKCPYCAFISTCKLSLIKDYTKSLIQEIKHYYKDEPLETLYFGGGTPSLLSVENIKDILSTFKFEKNAEITIEMNPNSVDLIKLKEYKNLGINRISLGVQAFDDNLLKGIKRAHNKKEALEAIKNIKEAGFDNFSIDLIYGLNNQTLELWENTLKEAISLEVPHISLYGLKIEKGTEFDKKTPTNLPDDEIQAMMYEMAIEKLENYTQYEFSNFSIKDKHSRHNLAYWTNKQYWGFGASASGFVDNKRYQNENDILNYIKEPLKEKEYEIIDEKASLEEHIFLGLRLSMGIDVEYLNKKFNINFEEQFKNQLDMFLKETLIEKTQKGYKLSTNGVLMSNYVLSEFLI